MTAVGLIKRGDPPTNGLVRDLNFEGGDERFATSVPEHQAQPQDPEFVALQRVVDELRRALDEQERAFATAIDDARTKGRKEAEIALAQENTRALALLQSAVEKAARGLDDKLAVLDVLALQVAQAALEKVFANVQAYQDLVTRAISRQIEQLRTDAIVRVFVSAADFPNDAAIRKTAQSIASERIEIRSDPQLPRGDCQIDLRLGHMEISLAQHWDALQSLVRRLGENQHP